MYTDKELKILNEVKNVVYTITNLVSGRVIYVGKTLNTWNERYKTDDDNLIGAKRINRNNVNYLVMEQIEKYGADNFKIDIVYKLKTKTKDTRTRDYNLLRAEFYYMVKYDTFVFDGGCNINYNIEYIEYVLHNMNEMKVKETRRALTTLVKCLMNNCIGRFGVHSRFLMNDNMLIILNKWNEVNSKKQKLQADGIKTMLMKMELNVIVVQESHRHGQFWHLDEYYKNESKPLTKKLMLVFKRNNRKLTVFEVESIINMMIGTNYIHNYILGGCYYVRNKVNSSNPFLDLYKIKL